MKTADDICADYAGKKVNLTLRLIAHDEQEEFPVVLIEGSATALKMLAKLLVAVADEPNKDGFSLEPKGAGSTHFSPEATLGFYIHRLEEEK